MRRRLVVLSLVLAALAAGGALGWHLAAGARYRLYTSAPAGDCWRALELATLATSTLRPVSVHRPVRAADGRTRASIEYAMDRVLGGRTLEVTCVFTPGGLESMAFDGVALDAEALADVRGALAD